MLVVVSFLLVAILVLTESEVRRARNMRGIIDPRKGRP